MAHRIGFIAAIAYFVCLVGIAVTATDSALYFAFSVTGFFSGLTCWVVSVYVWSLIRPRTFFSFVVLFFLVTMGFLWSWVYMLFHRRPRETAGSNELDLMKPLEPRRAKDGRGSAT